MKDLPKKDTHEASGGGLGGEEIDYAPLPATEYPQCPTIPVLNSESEHLS